jgi:transcriptional activator of cad operon
MSENDDGSGRLDGPLLIGEWRVDPRADEIASGDRVIKLEPLRMRLLMALARRPGEVVLSQELLDSVWEGVVVTPGSLYQSVAQLRQVLGDSAAEPRYIATVPRKGYRLVAPVRPLPAAALRVEEGGGAPAAAIAAPVAPQVYSPALLVYPPAPEGPPVLDVPLAPAPTRPGYPRLRRRSFIAAGVAASTALAAGGLWWWDRRAPDAPVRIAVFPFADPSAGKLDQPLANGLAEDIIHALERYPALEVIAYDAVSRFPQGAAALHEAWSRLDVRYALQGDLRRTGERVHVTTRLVQLPGEKTQSAASYDESMADLARLPNAIAIRTADALRLEPLPLSVEATSTGAYEMSVLGYDALRGRTPDSIERARRYFTQGIELDARYARNYSGLGSSWIVQSEVGGRISTGEAFARAEPLYLRALKLDPNLVDAKLGLANVARQNERYDEARRIFEGVIQEYPNNIQARFGLGLTEASDGWPSRAVVQYERAAALNPTHYLIPVRAGLSMMYLGRLTDAEARFKRSIELDGARFNGYYSLGILNWVRGRLDASVGAYRDALQRGDQAAYVWYDYAFTCTDLGLYDEARRAFERASQLSPSTELSAARSGFVWIAEGRQRPPPAVLAGSDPVTSIDRLLVLAMLGERPSASEVDVLTREQAGLTTPATNLYDVVCGRFHELEVATLFFAAGAMDRATLILNEVERWLNNYEQRGVTAPAFSFHRARILAMRGDVVRAVAALQTAVDHGWKRMWWVRTDPALGRLRDEDAFNAMVAKVEAELAVQRQGVPQR